MLLDGASGDRAHDFADDGVGDEPAVAVHRPRFEEGSLTDQSLGDNTLVGELVDGKTTVGPYHSGAVDQHVTHRDAVLARCGEPWPVVGHRPVDIEGRVLDQQRHHQPGRALARGMQTREGGAGHLAPGPQVHHLPAPHERGQLRTRFPVLLGDDGGELGAHLLISVGDGAVYFDRLHCAVPFDSS
ncbi:Uncharacterised protein [Mycobacteroides abscessus subsp. abscessus]|nr:Uncharacterised protein [Mycobacteroides abscessus subsp. abscessus]